MKKILMAIVVLFFLSGCAMLRAEGERWKQDPLNQALDTAAEIMLLNSFYKF